MKRSLPLGLLLCACGNDPVMMSPDMTPLAAELSVCTAFMPPGAMSSTGAMPTNAGACTEATTAITGAAAADIVPTGYTALGPAVTFSLATATVFPHGVDFVVPCDMGKALPTAPASRVVVVEKRSNGAVVITPVTNMIVESGYGRLHFHGDEMGTYQAIIPSTAGNPVMRHFTYRALAGVSMGGIGSSVNFWAHPDRYDALSVMGADPGPDIVYDINLARDLLLGGFCTADDEAAGIGKVGESELTKPACQHRKALADQFEYVFDFEQMNYQAGDGVGLTLKRGTFLRAYRDLSRGFGNGAYGTLPSTNTMGGVLHGTYLPPGVGAATLSQASPDLCAHPTVLKNFFDQRFNPKGDHDVITFCDGVDDPAHLGWFPTDGTPQTLPTQTLLAVDVNGNGKRDQGEPVIVQLSEPYSDVGTDGLADKDEPGYDPVTNPDPNHDDFHWLHNPDGKENNGKWDTGEPYVDSGLDGVKGKGCPLGSADGCYDLGEGNGKYDLNPNVANWFARDPRLLSEAADSALFDRINIYYDAGIRDFLNTQVATNSLAASLHARGNHVRVWDGFPMLVDKPPADEIAFDVSGFDWERLGRRAYVRYGDPDASLATQENTGDGRHVGTALQATHRALMMFYSVSHVWPGGDISVDGNLDVNDPINAMFTAKNGRVTPYSVVLPPGYDAHTDERYPVLYLFHGYGMKPADLGMVAAIAQGFMVNPKVPDAKRMQKFIIVAVDGMCRPGGDLESGTLSLDPKTDICEEGTFYADHPDGTAKAETQLLELEDLIDTMYRTKMPADLMVTQ